MRFRLTKTPLRYTILALWVVFALFPIYWTVVTAFKRPVDIFNGPKFIPFVDYRPTTKSWTTLFGPLRSSFLQHLVHSIVFASASSAIAVVLGGIAAYGLARYRYRYALWRNDDLSFLIVSQRIMPPIVAVLAFYIIFVQLGLLDTAAGMILAYTSFNLPLAVFVLRSFFEAIPPEVEEAAACDGYGRARRLALVVFPLASPGLAAAFLLCFFFAWNDFLFALMLTFQKAQTIPLFITNLNTQDEPLWWLISAVALVTILPPLLITMFLDRFMQRQVLQGGVR